MRLPLRSPLLALFVVLAGVALIGVGVTTLARPAPSAPSPAAGGFAGGNDTHAPDFRLPAVDGRTVSLSEYRGKKNVLLYFNMGVG